MFGVLIVVGATLSLSWILFLAAGEAAQDPGRPRSRPSASRCPYCREALRLPTRSCPGCATLHHRACWQEHEGCSVFGCRLAGDTTIRSGAPAPPELTPEIAPEPAPERHEARAVTTPAG